MKNIQISPSILSADFSQLGKDIKRLEDGGADLIHVDVMDGHFVPNITIGPPVIKTLRNYTKLPFDVHLMISPVHKYIKNFAEAGSDIITIHPEATDNLIESIQLIKQLKKKVGISFKPLFFLIFSRETGIFNLLLYLTFTATNRFSLSVGSVNAVLMTSTIPTISLPIFE